MTETIKFKKTISTEHYSVHLTELAFLNSTTIRVLGSFEQDPYISQCKFAYKSSVNNPQCWFESSGEKIHEFDIFSFDVFGNREDYIISYKLEFTPLSEDRIIENVISAYTSLLSKIEAEYIVFQEKLKSINEENIRLLNNIKKQINNIKVVLILFCKMLIGLIIIGFMFMVAGIIGIIQHEDFELRWYDGDW